MNNLTFDRWSLGQPSWETAFDNDPDVRVVERVVFLNEGATPYDLGDVRGCDIAPGTNQAEPEKPSGTSGWIHYKVWEPSSPDVAGDKVDILFVHGFAEYMRVLEDVSRVHKSTGAHVRPTAALDRGRYVVHFRELVAAGHRVIALDQPGHGLSTGPPAHIESHIDLPLAVFTVLSDSLSRPPFGRGVTRVALSGCSLGGLFALLAGLYWSSRPASFGLGRDLDVAGVYALCPVVGMTRADGSPLVIPRAIHGCINILSTVLGSWRLLHSDVAAITDDSRVSEDLEQDPRALHGKMRLCIANTGLNGMTELNTRAAEYNIPVRIIHGDRDAATSHLASVSFVRKVGREDCTHRVLAGYHHAIVRSVQGQATPREREPNDVVFDERLLWLAER